MGVGLAQKFLPQIHEFKKNYPEINLQLIVTDFRGIYYGLKNNQLDFAITGELGLMTLKNIRTQKIFTAHNLLILPSSHFFTKNSRDFSLLAKENFILLHQKVSPQGYEKVLELCASFGFTPHIVRNCMSIEEILFQVQAGQGITILPNFDCKNPEIYDCIAIPLKDAEQSFPIIAAWKSNNKNSGITMFRSVIK